MKIGYEIEMVGAPLHLLEKLNPVEKKNAAPKRWIKEREQNKRLKPRANFTVIKGRFLRNYRGFRNIRNINIAREDVWVKGSQDAYNTVLFDCKLKDKDFTIEGKVDHGSFDRKDISLDIDPLRNFYDKESVQFPYIELASSPVEIKNVNDYGYKICLKGMAGCIAAIIQEIASATWSVGDFKNIKCTTLSNVGTRIEELRAGRTIPNCEFNIKEDWDGKPFDDLLLGMYVNKAYISDLGKIQATFGLNLRRIHHLLAKLLGDSQLMKSGKTPDVLKKLIKEVLKDAEASISEEGKRKTQLRYKPTISKLKGYEILAKLQIKCVIAKHNKLIKDSVNKNNFPFLLRSTMYDTWEECVKDEVKSEKTKSEFKKHLLDYIGKEIGTSKLKKKITWPKSKGGTKTLNLTWEEYVNGVTGDKVLGTNKKGLDILYNLGGMSKIKPEIVANKEKGPVVELRHMENTSIINRRLNWKPDNNLLVGQTKKIVECMMGNKERNVNKALLEEK
jgi:hypothetical protein